PLGNRRFRRSSPWRRPPRVAAPRVAPPAGHPVKACHPPGRPPSRHGRVALRPAACSALLVRHYAGLPALQSLQIAGPAALRQRLAVPNVVPVRLVAKRPGLANSFAPGLRTSPPAAQPSLRPLLVRRLAVLWQTPVCLLDSPSAVPSPPLSAR